jgi:hypothetical protein
LSTLGVQIEGAATTSDDGAGPTCAATLGVLGGTGRYATATGTDVFTGSRTAARGTTVSPTVDLAISGAT